MTWDTILDPALSGRLCLMLLQSLWQVTLLAVGDFVIRKDATHEAILGTV